MMTTRWFGIYEEHWRRRATPLPPRPQAGRLLPIIEARMPDLLILDLNMPPPDGFELLKRKRSKFPGLRILVISGCLEGTLLEAARIFGATATLEKPVTAEALIGKVREMLGR
jgi:CheY-like chemotaxis protein